MKTETCIHCNNDPEDCERAVCMFIPTRRDFRVLRSGAGRTVDAATNEPVSAACEAAGSIPSEAQIDKALEAAHFFSTPESRKDMRNALRAALAVPSEGIASVAASDERHVFDQWRNDFIAREGSHPEAVDAWKARAALVAAQPVQKEQKS